MEEEMEEEILKWHIDTFGDCDEKSQWLKLLEELKEFETSKSLDDKTEECADIVIVSYILKARFNNRFGEILIKELLEECDMFEVEPFVEKKMKRNKERVWKKVSNGTYHHEESEKDE